MKKMFRIMSLFLLMMVGLFSIQAQEGTKTVTGVVNDSRVIESKDNIDINQFSAEKSSEVSIVSEKDIIISTGTTIWEGSEFSADTGTVSGDYDTLVNVENVAPPQSVTFNTAPSNMEAVDPMGGIVELEAPVPNHMGSAEISYPIWTPEGINGLTPEIILLYNSDNEEGNSGYGWNLEHNKIEHNLEKGLPSYSLEKLMPGKTFEDQLVLNSSELVFIAEDARSNRTYRQKVDNSFSEIRENYSNGFIVSNPDGSVLKYGESLNSKVYNPDNTDEVFAWYINEVKDKWGNKITYEYISSGNEKYVSKIKYAYTDAATHLYEIKFTWVDRSDDLRIKFNSGFKIVQSKILKRIEVHSTKSGCLKRYDFAYDRGLFRKYILSSIKEYADGTTTTLLNHHSFGYDASYAGKFAPEEKWDFYVNYDNNGGKVCGAQATGSYAADDEVKFADLNGDSLVDVMRIDEDSEGNCLKIVVELNMGSGFLQGSTWMGSTLYPGDKQIEYLGLRDLDNDGRPDLLLRQNKKTTNTQGNTIWVAEKILYYRNTGSTFLDMGDNWLNIATILGSNYYPEYLLKGIEAFTDINGDNRVDLYVKNGTSNILFLNGKNGFETSGVTWSGSSEYLNEEPQIDMNGDGLRDLHEMDQYDSCFYMNEGTSFDSSIERFSISTYYVNNGVFCDINGDGLPDQAVYEYKSGGKLSLKVSYNTGVDFGDSDTDWFVRTFSSTANISLKDMNGDGTADILRQAGYNSWYVSLNNFSNKNVLTRVFNHTTGNEITLEYNKQYLDPNRLYNENHRAKFVLSAAATENTFGDLTENAGIQTRQSFTYGRGFYDYYTKEFRGFNDITTESEDTTIPGRTVKRVSTVEFNILAIDEYGLYDDYLTGLMSSRTDWIVDGGTWIPRSKTKYSYSKLDIFAGKPDVKFVANTETRQWFYKDDGSFIDPADTYAQAKGYVVETKSYTFNTQYGRISSFTQTDMVDPLHTNDDTITTIHYTAGSSSNTRYFPYKVTVTDKDLKLISRKTSFYDNQTEEGAATSGKLTSEQIWNNNSYSNDGDAVKKYEYDIYGNIKKTSSCSTKILNDPAAGTVVIEYAPITEPDCFMKVTTTGADGLRVVEKYNWYGEKKEAVDGVGEHIFYEYDHYGRVTNVRSSWGDNVYETLMMAEYKSTGGLFSAEVDYREVKTANTADQAYISVEYYSDCLGRTVQVKTESEILNPETSLGKKVWGVTGRVEYDTLGRIVRSGEADAVDFYDNSGYVATNPLTSATTVESIEYDIFDRVVKKINRSGVTLSYFYDLLIDIDEGGDKRILTETIIQDNLGHEVVLYKDLAGKQVKTKVLKDELGNYAQTTYEYDIYGNEKTTSPGNKVITKKSDSLGRLWEVNTPDAGSVTYQYKYKDLVSSIIEEGRNISDSVKRTCYYTYDGYDRLRTVNYAGDVENDLFYEYYLSTDPGCNKSRIKKISMGDIVGSVYPYEVSFSYDKFSSSSVKKVDNQIYTTTLEKDYQGKVTSIIYPDNTRINYLYNSGGNLAVIKNSNGSYYIKSIFYDKFGQRVKTEYGNGAKAEYQYNPLTRHLDTYTIFNGAGSKILSYDYDFTSDGNIRSIKNLTQKSSTQNYYYDKLGRLTSADGVFNYGTISNSYTRTFQYNDDGRMLQKKYSSTDGGSGEYNYVHDSVSNSIDYIFDGAGNKIIDFSYDDFGNMVDKSYSGDSNKNQALVYAQNNRMKSLSGGAYNLSFEYDNKGQRIKKSYTAGGRVERSFVYVNGFYTANDIGGDGVWDVQNRHIWDGSNLVATEIGNDPGKTHYYHSNHIGSTALLTDNGGNEIRRYLYFPYGESWVSLDNSANSQDMDTNKLYTGQERDKESGLYYYNARYYDSDICVFTRPDPAMEGANHYGYVVGNPVMYNDPTGMRTGPRSGYGRTMANKAKKAAAASRSAGRDAAYKKARSLSGWFKLPLSASEMTMNNLMNMMNGNSFSSHDFSLPSTLSFNVKNCVPSGGSLGFTFGPFDGGGFSLSSSVFASGGISFNLSQCGPAAGGDGTSNINGYQFAQGVVQGVGGLITLGVGIYAGHPGMIFFGAKNTIDGTIKTIGAFNGFSWNGMIGEGLGTFWGGLNMWGDDATNALKRRIAGIEGFIDIFTPSPTGLGYISYTLSSMMNEGFVNFIGGIGDNMSDGMGSFHGIELGPDGDMGGGDVNDVKFTPRDSSLRDYGIFVY